MTGVHACCVTKPSVSMCVISPRVLLLIIEMTNIGLNLAVDYRNDSVNCGKHWPESGSGWLEDNLWFIGCPTTHTDTQWD